MTSSPENALGASSPAPRLGLSRGRQAALGLAAAGFIAAGVLHFVKPRMYERIMPPSFPSRATLVAVSGVAEIAGGVGLLVPRLRRAAGWGLIALLIAVFPANIYMAVRADEFTDLGLPGWFYWIRLPMQAVLIAWVWVVSLWRPRGQA